MKAEKINILKYITFGSLIVCIINCVMSLVSLINGGFDNSTVVGILFIAYAAMGVGFLVLALGLWKNNVKVLADIILVSASSVIYFVELFTFEHNWTLLLTFLGFFALLLMKLYYYFSDNNNKSFAFFVISILLFGVVFCSNLFLAFRDLSMGASLDIINFLLFFISKSAMILYCIWLFGFWYGFKKGGSFKETASRYKSQLTDKEYVFTVDKNGVGHLSGFKQNTRNKVRIKKFIMTDIKQNPTEYIYTSATVGGITTGGITKIGGNYAYTHSGTNKYKLYSSISGEKIEIKKIQMETPEVIESAEKHPIVKNFIKGNQLVLENELSAQSIDNLQAAGRFQDVSYFKKIATQNYIETLLTKSQCEAVLNWMCDESNGKTDLENSSNTEKIEYYKKLLDSGKISEEEFAIMQKMLLEDKN